MEEKQPIIIELNMKKITRDSIILTVILLLLFIIINAFIHQRFSVNFSLTDILIVSACYFLLIVLHEAFHLIGFMLFGKNTKYKTAM